MPLTRKHQLGVKIENREGTDAWGGSAPAAADIIRATSPQVTDTADLQEEETAGSTLDTDFAAVGRENGSITFGSQLVGNVTGASDAAKRVALPPFDAMLRAAGLAQVALYRITGTFTGKFRIGERVAASAWAGSPTAWGIVMSPGSTTAGELFVVPVEGTISAGTSFYGEQSGATCTTATVDTSTGGVCYHPESTKSVDIDITAGGWTGSAPVAGDVLVVTRSGIQVASCLVLTAADPIRVAVFYGDVAAGDTLTTDGGDTATVDTAGATAIGVPSLSIYSNLDSRERRLVGTRGTATLGGAADEILKWAWNFSGTPTAPVDAPQVSGASPSTLQGPRFRAATIQMGYDRNGDGTGYFDTALPLKSIGLDLGNTIEPRRDPTASTGIRGANLTQRAPKFTCDPEQVGVLPFDWALLRRQALALRFGMMLGSEVGNRLSLAIPRGQVESRADGDDAGLALDSISIACRRIRDAGDDSFFIAKF